jgi:hypothetical protein
LTWPTSHGPFDKENDNRTGKCRLIPENENDLQFSGDIVWRGTDLSHRGVLKYILLLKVFFVGIPQRAPCHHQWQDLRCRECRLGAVYSQRMREGPQAAGAPPPPRPRLAIDMRSLLAAEGTPGRWTNVRLNDCRLLTGRELQNYWMSEAAVWCRTGRRSGKNSWQRLARFVGPCAGG